MIFEVQSWFATDGDFYEGMRVCKGRGGGVILGRVKLG